MIETEMNDLKILYDAGVAIASTLSLKDVIWTLYKESSRFLDTSNFAIALYDDQTDTLSFGLLLVQGKRVTPFAVKVSAGQKLAVQILKTRAPSLIPDLSQTATQVEVAQLQPHTPIRSLLGVPIFSPTLTEQGAQGVLLLWHEQAAVFTEHHLWLASSISKQAAIAIRNARLYEASQRRAKETTALNEVARALSETLQLDEVLTRIMQHVNNLLNVAAGSLLLTDPTDGDLVFQISLGDKADEVRPFRVPKGQGVAGEVASTGKPLIIADTSKDKRHFKGLDQQVSFQTRNILCVPLILHEQIIGVLEVMNKRVGNFNKNDLTLLQDIAYYAAIAIENARLHESVLAERDRVIEAEEQARKELARDLHDGPTQLVAGIMMSLDFCHKAWDRDRSLIPRELDAMQDLASRATHQMRTMLFELRPLVLETSGLEPAVKVFLERRQKDVQAITKLTMQVNTHNPTGELSRQDIKVERSIFAIVQETVNNALKHARAKNITVTFQEDHQALLTTIVDDGKGFDVQKTLSGYDQRGSLGMINLKERTEVIGGTLTMESQVGQGTRITVWVPKAQEERMKRRMVTGPLTMPNTSTLTLPNTSTLRLPNQ